MQTMIPIKGEVVAVVSGLYGRRVYRTSNLVMTTGDVHYAERMSAQAPTNVFDSLAVGTGGATPAKADTWAAMVPVAGSLKRFDAGYPKVADADVANTGSGPAVATYRVTYAASEAIDGAIENVAVTNFQNGTPGAAEPLLCHAKFSASFAKTGTDTLTIYWNHTVLGA